MIPGGYALSLTCDFSISTTSDISSCLCPHALSATRFRCVWWLPRIACAKGTAHRPPPSPMLRCAVGDHDCRGRARRRHPPRKPPEYAWYGAYSLPVSQMPVLSSYALQVRCSVPVVLPALSEPVPERDCVHRGERCRTGRYAEPSGQLSISLSMDRLWKVGGSALPEFR